MRVTTHVMWDMETGAILARDSYEYSGPFEELKKGREGEKADAKMGQSLAKTDTGIQQGIQPSVTNFAESLLPGATSPGGLPGSTSSASPSGFSTLSPYAAAQYGSDLENVASTYGNLGQAAYKMLGATGFGNAPAGRQASIINTLGNEEGQAQTGAYRNALNNTYNEGVTGAGILQNQENIFNPVPALNSSQTGFANLNKMGSTLGDVATGIADLAPVVAAPFTGGASLLALGGPMSGFGGLMNRNSNSAAPAPSTNIPGYSGPQANA